MGRNLVCLAALTVCVLASGCFSYGYSPYYQAGTYGTVPRPGGAVYQTAPGVAPGTYWVPATPQPGPVAGSTAAPPSRIATPQPVDRFDDEAPSKPVPQPTEPGGRSQPLEETDAHGSLDDSYSEQLGVRTATRRRITRPEELELADPNAIQLASGSDATPTNDDSLPEVTAGLESAEFKTEVVNDPTQPDPRFGYDTRNYSWLQGMVEQGRGGSWHLIYGPTPDDSDQFGGEVTLKPTRELTGIRNRAFIRVEGRFDPNERDRLGKPLYEIDPRSIEIVRLK